jgi:DNA-binding PadR family transcriptional regulator
MDSPVTTRAALLLALREGPGYGLDLIRRVVELTRGRVRLSEARVYPSLKALEKEGLARVSIMAPKGRRGARSRTYYDLTVAGVEASNECREALRALAAGRPRLAKPAPADRVRMANRLIEADALATFATELAEARPAARRLRS